MPPSAPVAIWSRWHEADELGLRPTRSGVPDAIPTVDGLLAATARVANLTLVTRNTADLIHTGTRLLDPFNLAQSGP